jgi:16S rRNA C967 or C1407 C5-methylase (RsmB/RsmF family)
MANPPRLLLKLAQQVFDGDQQQAFITALTEPTPTPPTILWTRPRPVDQPFAVLEPLPWQPSFVDRLAETTARPGQHPLHEAGHFYCLDFSSVFAASVLQAIPTPVTPVIDLCAAPGGKSLFAWVALQPQTLVCNEVIGKRLGMLISNLKRCQVQGAKVLNLDSQVLANKTPQTAAVVIVDAPCSGQSLLAKGESVPGCFHPVTLNKNANRQKRILANAAQLVAGGGYLAYMTCTYAPTENEQVCQWFLNRFPQFQPVTVPHLSAYQSHLTEMPCYRLWPQSGLGAGAFTALFQNTGNEPLLPLPEEVMNHPVVVTIEWV